MPQNPRLNDHRTRTIRHFLFRPPDWLLTAAVIFGCLGTIAVSAAFLHRMYHETTQTR